MIKKISERLIDFEYVKAIIGHDRDRIHQIPGVIGTGISHSDITGIGKGHHLVVYLEHEDLSIIRQLPSKIHNIPVTYQVKGKIRALSCGSRFGFASRYRPLQGGSSISPLYGWTTGTIAGFPQLPNGQHVLLSNNHTIAPDNPGLHTAQVGQSITQPGNADYGTNNDIVGNVAKWIPIISGSIFDSNKVDCAYATILPDISINQINLCGFDINYTVPPFVGMSIKSAGKVTGCTYGTITELDASVQVDYSVTDTPAYARFTGQIETSPNLAQKGDSGSVIVTSDTNNAVGLLFAAGSDGGATCNVMSDVERALGVSFGTGPPVPTPQYSIPQFIIMGGLVIGLVYFVQKTIKKEKEKVIIPKKL